MRREPCLVVGAYLVMTGAPCKCLALPSLALRVEVAVRAQRRQHTADDGVKEVTRDASRHTHVSS